MTRLWHTGFEWQSATTGVEWNTSTGTISISTATKRTGAASLRCNPTAATGFITHRFRADSTVRCFIRIYLYIASLPSADTDILRYGDGTYNPYTIRLRTTGVLALYSGGTQLGSDTPSSLNTSQWYRIELDYNDASSDAVEAFLDGTSFASATSSGDVAGGGVISVGVIGTATADLYFDDIAVNDSAGSVNNSLPGAGGIVIALPTGAGDNAATTGIYSYINEVPPSDTATSGSTMIELDANPTIGDYEMTDSSALGMNSADTVNAILILGRIREETAGTSNYTLRIKSASGGTTTSSASVDAGNATPRTNPSSTTAFGNLLISETDPTTGVAWTPTGTNSIDNMQVGVGTTDGTPDIWCLALCAMIDYTPSAVTSIPNKIYQPKQAVNRASTY